MDKRIKKILKKVRSADLTKGGITFFFEKEIDWAIELLKDEEEQESNVS